MCTPSGVGAPHVYLTCEAREAYGIQRCRLQLRNYTFRSQGLDEAKFERVVDILRDVMAGLGMGQVRTLSGEAT